MADALPPAYREALAEEAEARDFAFLGDIPTPLCGTPVFPLDLRNQILLTHAGNRFVCSGAAELEDVRMLLWLQSPLHAAGNSQALKKFLESLPPIAEADAVAQVRQWIDETFADAPPGKTRPKGSEDAVLEEPISSFVSGWVDLLASEYGWRDDYIVGTAARRGVALRKLFQYYRNIVRRRDPDHPFSSARIVKIHAEWLRGPDDGAGEAKPLTGDAAT